MGLSSIEWIIARIGFYVKYIIADPPLTIRPAKEFSGEYQLFWAHENPQPVLVVPGRPQEFKDFALEPACIAATKGWMLLRDTVRIRDGMSDTPGCYVLCPENPRGNIEDAPNLGAGQCKGLVREREVCFTVRMSVNQQPAPNNHCKLRLRITSDEIEER